VCVCGGGEHFCASCLHCLLIPNHLLQQCPFLLQQGEANESFWATAMCATPYGSGSTQQISGWVATLFPYTADGVSRAPTTATPLQLQDIPNGAPALPFTYVNAAGQQLRLELRAGFLGCRVDGVRCSVVPCVGWEVAADAAAHEDALVDHLQASVEAAIARNHHAVDADFLQACMQRWQQQLQHLNLP
jgi:hypothetical protein